MSKNILKVAIQGDKGSFHELAAQKYYTYPVTLLYCRSFDEVFESLRAGTVDKAFVATENSNHGEIEDVALLMKDLDVIVEGEYLLPIEQHIVGLLGADLSKVHTVVSHPVALSQCDLYLSSEFGHARIEGYHDTSAAIYYVKQLNDPSVAAIGSEAAAALHGLTILQRAVQNDADNATLFKSIAVRAAS